MQLTDIITSPLATLSTFLTFIAHLLGFIDPIVTAIWSTVGTWYPAVAITSSTILPKLGTVSVPVIGLVDVPGLAQQITIVGALIYVAYLGDRTFDKWSKNTEN